jgi:putative aldouronate transport system substrate-binding protein
MNGRPYGVSTVKSGYGAGGTYLIKKSALDAAGLSYQNMDLVTLEDLTNIFAKVKEALPDIYPCGLTGLNNVFGFTQITDTLGDTAASGVLIGTESTEVVNMFATPEFKSFLEYLREWYLNGYIVRDAATTDMNMLDYLYAGATSGYFADGQEFLRTAAELSTGEDFVQLRLIDPYRPSIAASGNVYWSVPVTAQEPEAAMRFLDLMFKDEEVVNLIQWGIEGVHYVMQDPDMNLIAFPEGIDATTSGYYNPYGVFGDTRMCYIWDPAMSPAVLADFTQQTLANPTMGVGFCYDSSNMTSQIMAVQNVITEYQPALCTGTADLETTYAEFLIKLEQNGINEIIADKQAQYDAWRAGN